MKPSLVKFLLILFPAFYEQKKFVRVNIYQKNRINIKTLIIHFIHH